MEHRWGQRVSADVIVRLIAAPGAIGTGRMRADRRALILGGECRRYALNGYLGVAGSALVLDDRCDFGITECRGERWHWVNSPDPWPLSV